MGVGWYPEELVLDRVPRLQWMEAWGEEWGRGRVEGSITSDFLGP